MTHADPGLILVVVDFHIDDQRRCGNRRPPTGVSDPGYTTTSGLPVAGDSAFLAREMDDPLPPPTISVSFVPPAAVPVLKHSWLGIASFILSLAGGFAMLLLFGVAGYLQMTTPGGMDEKSATAVFVGLLLFAVMAVHVVGLGLGIGGLLQKDRKKVFSVLGLVFNGLVIVVTLALVVIGNKMQ